MARILVVDDDPDILHLVALAFEGAGHDVRAVADPTTAAPLARSGAFDAVVLDVLMQRRSGWEVLEELRQDGRTERLPVLMLSAIGDAPTRVRGLRLGADDFLAKPFHPEELVARVEGLVARHAAERRGLGGDFATLTVGDLLQSLEGAAASGELAVVTPAGDAELRFTGGRCVGAAFAGLEGVEAVVALLEERSGSFRLYPDRPIASGPDGPLPMTAMLLEAGWIQDALHSRLGSLPPEDRALSVVPDLAAPEMQTGLPALPVETVLACLAARPGTSLGELLAMRLASPARVKLTVAWLAEEGIVRAADGEDGATAR